jgi:hypothetical protein
MYIFGLKDTTKFPRNNAYDGIFIVRNNIGLPNNINLFDWNNEQDNFSNNVPELRELGSSISLFINQKFELKLSNLISGFNKWFNHQPVVNKKLKLVIIDNSCRNIC